mmetsp:Transcript_36664/g.42610  ORF Transcript_36664/g.42610 Transcript_36664/m.42610 type:complete len:94 (+) Transcript_36664:235-516(+)
MREIMQAKKQQYPLIKNKCESSRWLKRTAATRAPIFPDAALIPWHIVRTPVGKISEDIKNVVVFGPHCPKKELKRYKATNDLLSIDSYMLPHT